MEAATPRELAWAWDPGADIRWTKTKNATSRGNVFETNILLASPERVRHNGNQQYIYIKSENQRSVFLINVS